MSSHARSYVPFKMTRDTDQIDENKLPFLQVTLSHNHSDLEIQNFVLKDSGCEKSIISISLIKAMGLEALVQRLSRPMSILSVTGHASEIIGSIVLNMTFHDNHGKFIKVRHNFLVVSENAMTRGVIIGANFCQNDAYKTVETNLHFRLNPSPAVSVAGEKSLYTKIFYRKDIEPTVNSTSISLLPQKSTWIKIPLPKQKRSRKSLLIPLISTEIEQRLKGLNSLVINSIAVTPTKDHFKISVTNTGQSPSVLDKSIFENIQACDISNDIVARVKVTSKPSTTQTSAAKTQVNPLDRVSDSFAHQCASRITVASTQIIASQNTPTSVCSSQDPTFFSNSFNDDLGDYLVEINNVISPENKPHATSENFNFISPQEMFDESIGPNFDLSDASATKTPLRDRFRTKHLSQDEADILIKTALKYPETWAAHKLDVGRIPNYSVPIHTNKKIFTDKFRPFPKNTHDIVMYILKMYKDAGVLQIAEDSPYALNMMLVKKQIPPEVLEKNPDAHNDPAYYRLILDGRSLNTVTIGHSLSLGQLEDLFLKLSDNKYIILIDIVSAYFNIEIDEKDRVLTSFYTPIPGVKMCYSRLPQGLKNSQLEFCKLMSKIMAPISQNMCMYVDDIALFANSLEDINRVFDTALQIMKKHNIKLLPEKTQLAPPEMKFCGLLWRNDGTVSIPEAKLQSFYNWPVPMKTRRQVAGWCSSINFFRRFFPFPNDLATLLTPFTRMLMAGAKIVWSQEVKEAYYKILDTLKQQVTLYIPPPGTHFILHSDASHYAAAGRLTFMDKTGTERLVACTSRTFNQQEFKHSTYMKELMALVFNLRSFAGWIRFSPCTIYVDCISLTYLALCKNSTPSIMRISIYLSQFDNIKLVHVPSKDNMADILTRNEHQLDEIRSRTTVKPLTKEEAEILIKQIAIPAGKQFSILEIRQLLAAAPLPSAFQTKMKCRCKVMIPPKAYDLLMLKERKKPEPSNKAPKPKSSEAPKARATRSPTPPPTARVSKRSKAGADISTELKKSPPLMTDSVTIGHINVDRSEIDLDCPMDNEDFAALSSSTKQPLVDFDNLISNVDLIPAEEDKLFLFAVSLSQPEENLLNIVLNTHATGKMSVETMIKLQSNDDFCNEVKATKLKKPNSPFFLHNGLLFNKSKTGPLKNKERMVLPQILVRPTFIKHHDMDISGIHVGPSLLYDTINARYFIPNLSQQIRDYTQSCLFCQMSINTFIPPSISPGNLTASKPREAIAIDLAFSFPKTAHGDIGIITIVDLFSQFCLAFPISSKNSKHLLNKFLYGYIMQFGHPKHIRIDGERGLELAHFKSFCDKHNIELHPISSGASWGNASVERRIVTIKRQLTAISLQSPQVNWSDVLPQLCMINNNLIRNSQTSFTPAEIMFGPSQDSEFQQILNYNKQLSIDDFVANANECRKFVRNMHKSNLDSASRSKLEAFNSSRTERQFSVGDIVWLKNIKIPTESGNALRQKFLGPYKILSIEHNVTAVIVHLLTGAVLRRHFNFLKPVIFDHNHLFLPNDWDLILINKPSSPLRRSPRLHHSSTNS